jgi:Coenzyme PQQ synthesis protein D (PqqD)
VHDLISYTHDGGFREGGGRHFVALKWCNGTVEEIAETLAKEYAAPVGVIPVDVLELLQSLADKGYIKA